MDAKVTYKVFLKLLVGGKLRIVPSVLSVLYHCDKDGVSVKGGAADGRLTILPANFLKPEVILFFCIDKVIDYFLIALP